MQESCQNDLNMMPNDAKIIQNDSKIMVKRYQNDAKIMQATNV